MEEDKSTKQEIIRPGIGTVIGILNIIFCSIGIIGIIFSFIGHIVLKVIFNISCSLRVEELELLIQGLNYLLTYGLIINVFMIASNGLGLTGGIGLLSNKRWSIHICLLYACLTIILLVVNYFLMFRITRHMFNNILLFTDEFTSEGMDIEYILRNFQTMVAGVAGVVGLILGCAYPVVVVILINTPRVKKFYLKGS